jgi:hypothetical protein
LIVHPDDHEIPDLEPGEPRYNSLDEVFFAIHAEHGPQGLREVLTMMEEVAREDLERAAAALEAAGKPSIAKIILEVAATARSGIDIDDPYEPGSTNSRYWRQSWARNRWVASGEMEKALREQASQQAGQKPDRKHVHKQKR